MADLQGDSLTAGQHPVKYSDESCSGVSINDASPLSEGKGLGSAGALLTDLARLIDRRAANPDDHKASA